MSALHPLAATGFSRGADAYATSRPGYPPEVMGWLRDRLGIAPGSDVLEIGAGTGKFTALLADAGAKITALEPVTEMLDHLVVDFPAVTPLIGRAEAIPLPDASVDAVVCATAFHWFATDAVVAEIRRVLRPGGTLGLIWNLRDHDTPWVAELSALTNSYEQREKLDSWQAPFPAPGFTPLHAETMHYRHVGSPEEVIVRRTLSTSFIAALPEDRRAEVVAEVRALIARTPELAGQSEVVFPYVTTAYDCRKVC